MAHPLYVHAVRLVGRPVYAHHINGTVYHGLLQSATSNGIYVWSYHVGYARLTDPDTAAKFVNADVDSNTLTPALAYSPGIYFGFGALAGLTLGALASPFLW